MISTRLASRRPIRSHLSTQGYAVERGLVVGFYVVNHTIVTDPTIRQPGFDLPRHTWSLANRFRTGQGPCRANLHKWGLAQSPSCDCGQRQTMNHIVDTCPLTKFEGGLNLLHEADDDTVIRLESAATAALAKQCRSQKLSTGGASICSIPFCPFLFSCPTKSAVQSKNVMT